MGIGIHNLSVSDGANGVATALELSAAVRQAAGGLLGTTTQFSDLVRLFAVCSIDDESEADSASNTEIGSCAGVPTLLT